MRVDDDDRYSGTQGTQVDPNGRFVMPGLAPGKYRVIAAENAGPMPEEGGQEVTVAEGETATVDIKPEAKP